MGNEDSKVEDEEEEVVESVEFAEVVGQDSLTRFDKTRNRSRGGR